MARPTKYKPELNGIVSKMCELGATDEDIIQALGIATSTYYDWRARYPEFSKAIKVGKEPCNERVKMAMYRRAVGYERTVDKVFQFQGQEVRIPVTEFVDPDVGAGKFWLVNRCSEEFKTSPESVGNETVIHNIMPVPTADSTDDWEKAAKSNQDGLLNRDE